MTMTVMTSPSVTARALLAGPSVGAEVTEVERVLRDLMRGGGNDWIAAAVTCPLDEYPRLEGDISRVQTATSADNARRLIEDVAALDRVDDSVTVLLLNDPHPFFDLFGEGCGLAETLRGLRQSGARRGVHLFARSPLLTDRFISRLCQAERPRRYARRAIA
ncbi:hypothetical protein [Demetria terragena]|uniref:hypothetical protein n=1 Tax=Demetria terragena TaxID=63959 RepID=UPI0003A97FCB|nr:hypothetical protein [Demetria terragena]